MGKYKMAFGFELNDDDRKRIKEAINLVSKVEDYDLHDTISLLCRIGLGEYNDAFQSLLSDEDNEDIRFNYDTEEYYFCNETFMEDG
jgi:hypothetical protein